ncbi:hypothetical protein DPEC_G00045560 [Dallia pectoralis]|uniref:Uncharacterized protein n=1 Tax=Dallia pectoralis TaxID=75939 RepID=A0ACC2HAJ8_DALPE|nr:hypothetical protein DPEC_G00045560 [Dallia pectoralis]
MDARAHLRRIGRAGWTRDRRQRRCRRILGSCSVLACPDPMAGLGRIPLAERVETPCGVDLAGRGVKRAQGLRALLCISPSALCPVPARLCLGDEAGPSIIGTPQEKDPELQALEKVPSL